ncbi:hypothetical protein SAMN06266787_11237 [Halorubrum ezzemoulense]|uniref:Glycosyltransferase RgtA/B/C/D-like domain-containing protein n=1 Tax=Halorubrum ezzemoulense TaxID=337243 RepID=A0A238YIY9_HALEZ|nr:hypothetical protein SAMN06266787_11237 [Halorubrum ezzemoulense]
MNVISKYFKIFQIFSLLTVVVSLLLLSDANSHEVSIYNSTPTIVWILISLSMILCIVYLIVGVFSTLETNLILPAIVIYVFILLVFSIPDFRGYYVSSHYASDIMVHFGEIRSIKLTSHISEDNFYPLYHIQLYSVHILGIELEDLDIVGSMISYIVFTFGMYCFARSVSNDTRSAEIAFAFSLPLIFLDFHVNIRPTTYSIMIMPFVLYLINTAYTKKSKRFLLLSLIGLLFISISHPETAIITLLILSIIFSTHLLAKPVDLPKKGVIIYSSLTLFIISYMWYISNPILQEYLSFRLISVIRGYDITTTGSGAAAAASDYPSILSVFTRVIELYGSPIIYMSLSGLSVFLIIYTKRFEISYPEKLYILLYSTSLFVSFVLLFGIQLFGDSIMRIVPYSLISSILVLSLFISNIGQYKIFVKKATIVLMVILLLLTVPLSIANVHSDNEHLTKKEVVGTQMFLQYYNEDYETKSLHMSSKLMAYLEGAHTEKRGDPPFYRRTNEKHTLPQKLGYQENQTSSNISEYTYIILKRYDYTYYEGSPDHMHKELSVYDNNDVEKLYNDESIVRVYSNGEFRIWLSNE